MMLATATGLSLANWRARSSLSLEIGASRAGRPPGPAARASCSFSMTFSSVAPAASASSFGGGGGKAAFRAGRTRPKTAISATRTRGSRDGGIAGHVTQPGLAPQRQVGGFVLVRHKRRADDLDRVAPVLGEAQGFLHQAVELFQFGIGQRLAGGLALGIGHRLLIDHHGRIEAAHLADRIAGDPHGAINFEFGAVDTAGVLRAAAGAGRLELLGLAVDRRGGLRRHLVGGGTRHTGRHRRGAADLLFGIHAAHRALGVGTLVRLELFSGRFHLIEVHIRRDGGAQVVATHHRLQQLGDALVQVVLDLLFVEQLLAVQAGAVVVVVVGEQGAGAVEHADGLGVELRHRGRDQMHDACNLVAVQGVAAAQGEHHRGAGLLLFAEEAVLLRNGQMHPGIGHIRHGGDGAGEFTFQAALEVQPFIELGLADGLLVHQLEADDAALGQPLRRQLHAQVIHLVRRDHDGAARLIAVGHIHLRQLGDDGAAVLVRQAGEQRAVVSLAGHHGHRHDDGQQGGQAATEHQLALGGHRGQAGREALGRFRLDLGGESGGRAAQGVVHGAGRSA